MTALDRFEALAALYYADTGHMRPGKDSRTEDTSSAENRGRFDKWVSEGDALTKALDRIVLLESKLEAIEADALDAKFREP
ncbi:MAG: hypothetical protein EPO32_14790 [Anaerolineae bacterium]|nr:MAG: hypothetical protein EPO32_14790 [Anaerolineae bacterium]